MRESEDLERKRMEGGPGGTDMCVCVSFDEVSSVNIVVSILKLHIVR